MGGLKAPEPRSLTDYTTKKERLTTDKVRSTWELVFGDRPFHFDAFLDAVPSSSDLTLLAQQCEKPDIDTAIFDLDGTLVSPYTAVPEPVLQLLKEYLADGRKVIIYTNSPHSDRLDALRDIGVLIAETGLGKPSLEGYCRLCDQHDVDPAHACMIGNFAINDAPLMQAGEEPLFPLNVLVESIPPNYKAIGDVKRWIRARTFHVFNVMSAGVVKARNPDMVRQISESPLC